MFIFKPRIGQRSWSGLKKSLAWHTAYCSCLNADHVVILNLVWVEFDFYHSEEAIMASPITDLSPHLQAKDSTKRQTRFNIEVFPGRFMVQLVTSHNGGVLKWGHPIAGWFIMENHGKSIYKWMMTGGTPMTKRKPMPNDFRWPIPTGSTESRPEALTRQCAKPLHANLECWLSHSNSPISYDYLLLSLWLLL